VVFLLAVLLASPARGQTVEIIPEALALKTGAPLSPRALVVQPAFVKGLRSWTVETRRHRGYIVTFVVSPDGKQFATGGLDGIVRVYEVETGQLVRALVGHGSYVYGLAWSPDGNTLASAGSFDLTARLWDMRTGMPLRVLKGHPDYVNQVAWSPDGRTLAVGGGGSGFIRLWDAATSREVRTFECGKHILALAWSPEGKRLASGGAETGAILWDPESGKMSKSLKQDGSDVYALAWSPDGKTLATGGKTNVALWDAEGGKKHEPLMGAASALAWTSDGKTLAVAPPGAVVQLWDPVAGKVVGPLDAGASGLLRVPGSSRILGINLAAVTVWDTAPAKRAHTWEVTAQTALHWWPGRPAVSGFWTTRLTLWDTATGKVLRRLPDFPCAVITASWSRDGKLLACACTDGKVRLFEGATGKPLPILEGHKGAVSALAWSPDGRQLASGSADKSIRLWTVGTEKPPVVLESDEPVAVLAWSAGGGLASGGGEGKLTFWNLTTSKAGKTTKETSALGALAWSPNGRFLATGGNDDTARVYTAATGKLLHGMESVGSPRDVTGVAWSSDGNVLASGRGNHTLQLWRVKDEKLVHSVNTLAPVVGVSWPTGSSTVATANSAGSVLFWDSIPGRLRASLVLQNDRLMAISGEGMYRATAEGEQELVVVAQEERAQRTLTPKEFATKYGWKNNPAAVRLTGN
jgi:WD40 repeat protein